MPEAEVEQLQKMAAPGSELQQVPDATHETVTYQMADLTPPVLAWLASQNDPGKPAGTKPGITTQ